jgi:hypothetical protein
MNPKIDSTAFGSITIKGEKYDHDITITINGKIKKRKKKLSKAVFGTSHIISLDEAKNIYQPDAKLLIVGTGQTGYVELSDEAARFLKEQNCAVQLKPTPEAIELWNKTKEKGKIGLFHVTC